MRILITGGTGFIGSRLALASLKNGDSVRVLGQTNNSFEADNKKLVESEGAEVRVESLDNESALSELLVGVDVVYHLAAAQHEANVPDKLFWDVNVEGTKNIIEASINSGVKRFVYGSTIGVYGSGLEGELNEESLKRPANIYGETKLEAEKVVLSYGGNIPVVIVRISETYGAGDLRLLKLFKAIKKHVFFMIGNGNNLHHLIYVDDLIEGLFLAANHEKAIGETFVFAGKDVVSSNEMVAEIAKEQDTKIPGLHAPLSIFLLAAVVMETVLKPIGIQPPLHRRRMDFFIKSFSFSNRKAGELLGFEPRYSFKKGVAATAKWYRNAGWL